MNKELSKVDRTFYNVSGQYLSLLNDIPYEMIRFTADHMLSLQDELPYELGSNLVLTLADHIAFAIVRAQRGVYIRMPSVYELELNYPREVKAGRSFVSAIRKKFRVKLPKDEVQGIAMHLINAQNYGEDEDIPGVEQHYEEILQKTPQIIEQELHVKVQQDTFN